MPVLICPGDTLAVPSLSSKPQSAAHRLRGETLGQRIVRIREERGYTQVELAGKIEIIQSNRFGALERDERRLSAGRAVHLTLALGAGMDELSRPADGNSRRGRKPSRKVFRCMEQIETLPPTK